jgi:integrase
MTDSQKVVRMPAPERRRKKVVSATQAAIDSLPYDSGDWVVRGVPGLVVRCGARTKTFRLLRRIAGKQVKRVLGELSLAEAKRQAMLTWRDLKPRPAGSLAIPTLREALDSYLAEKPLSPRTAEDYRYVLERYMGDLLDKRLDVLALDRAGMRARIAALTKKHGAATAALALRVYRAVHNWARKVHPDLQESPTTACVTPRVRPRDWALSDDELRDWWRAVQALTPLKRTWWLTLLLTGARRDSVRLLRWEDLDFDKRLIRFSTAKGGRTYTIPMADRLHDILTAWREETSSEEWVFESPVRPGEPLSVQVRDSRNGVCSPHHLRHTMRTRLAEAGATPDLARIVLGHSLSQDVSQRYLTASLLVEAVRPLVNAVAERYAEIMQWQ